MPQDEIKQRILNITEDLVSDFLYYDRQGSDYMPVGAIEQAMKEGIITRDEIIKKFVDTLNSSLPEAKGVD